MHYRFCLLRPAILLSAVLLVAAKAGAQEAAQPASPPDQTSGLRGSIGPDNELPATATNSAAQRQQRELRIEADKVRAAAAEQDPWAALGIRAGGFILYPSVELNAGWTSNAANTASGKASAESTITPQLLIQSDWSRHQLTLTLRGTETRYYDGTTLPDQSASAEATGRIDISRDWQADLNAGYFLTHQSPSDSDFPAGADDKPAVHTFDGGVEIKRAIGPATLSAITTVERAQYDPAHSGGIPIDQSDRDNVLWEARLRLAYAVTPITTPFVEIGVGRRDFDNEVDGSGFRRAADISLLRGGITYDSSPVLKAELAVGYRREHRDDPLLPDLAGVTLDGSVLWSPTRLTTLGLRVATSFNPTADASSAGSIAYDATADAAYAVRRNVAIHGIGEAKAEHFDNGGVSYTYSVGGGIDWKINRMLVANLRYTHKWTDLADPAGNYVADTVIGGVKVQK